MHLPRLKLEKEYDLKATLESMGMTLPFDKEKADLSGISQQHLYVSQAIHKSFVEVNEGAASTEGAAGSGAVAALVSGTMLEERVIFMASRPFVFLITHLRSGAVLFSGMYASP